MNDDQVYDQERIVNGDQVYDQERIMNGDQVYDQERIINGDQVYEKNPHCRTDHMGVRSRSHFYVHF